MLSNAHLYRQMALIRHFENKTLDAFSQGVFSGTTHTYIGQEANAVGVLIHLQEGDAVFSNHRCHGHFLASGGDATALFSEMMGKPSGLCAGRGGSQHIHCGRFFSNGIQGSSVPLGTGFSFGPKRQGKKLIAVVFIGDGTLGEGILYETLNMASLWNVPVLFVVENNGIAQTTPIEKAVAGSIPARFESFGIAIQELDSSDVLRIAATAGQMINRIRMEGVPQALVLHTCRFAAHSKGDDTRPKSVVAAMRAERDPLEILRQIVQPDTCRTIDQEVAVVVEQAFESAMNAPAYAGDLLDQQIGSALAEVDSSQHRIAGNASDTPAITVMASLNQGLMRAMQTNGDVVLLGEDILDPYGGAFKITRGLSSAFPDRVISTPISEAGFVGLAGGMAVSGLRPVVEIMFGDFLTLAADQLINSLAKFRWMYNGQASVPVVVRTPMGGHRGYGPTHSQTIEKHFLGVPGLRVLAPTSFGDPGRLLFQAIMDDDPVLFVENKLQYLESLRWDEPDLAIHEELPGDCYAPVYTIHVRGAPEPSVTLVTYGYMADRVREVMVSLAFEHEIFMRLIVPTQLSPLVVNLPIIKSSVVETRNLLVLEESTSEAGWGAEVLAQVVESVNSLHIRAGRVTAKNVPVPASLQLEKEVLPQVEQIMEWINENDRGNHTLFQAGGDSTSEHQ